MGNDHRVVSTNQGLFEANSFARYFGSTWRTLVSDAPHTLIEKKASKAPSTHLFLFAIPFNPQFPFQSIPYVQQQTISRLNLLFIYFFSFHFFIFKYSTWLTDYLALLLYNFIFFGFL